LPPAIAATSASLLLRAAGQLAVGDTAIDLEPKDALLLAYLALEGPAPRAATCASGCCG
jgi:hypothetical protein